MQQGAWLFLSGAGRRRTAAAGANDVSQIDGGDLIAGLSEGRGHQRPYYSRD